MSHALAVDTSFVVVGIHCLEPRHHRARHLLDRMEREGTLVVHCPHLLPLELWSACWASCASAAGASLRP